MLLTYACIFPLSTRECASGFALLERDSCVAFQRALHALRSRNILVSAIFKHDKRAEKQDSYTCISRSKSVKPKARSSTGNK